MIIKGTIKTIRFVNQASSWSVITIDTGQGEPIVATGIMPGVKPGMSVELDGDFTNGKYGPQFEATSYMESKPTSVEGIYKYLSSGLIRNIGPVFARKIVDTFGEQTIDILDKTPERLREIKGIGEKKVNSVISAVKDTKEIRAVMIWLKQNDLSNTLATKIYKTYGSDSIPKLQENPYRLYRDIKGVGFKKADETALKLGIPRDHDFRIQAGIMARLENWATNDGGTYMPREQLIESVAGIDYLDINPERVNQILDIDLDVNIDPSGNVSLHRYNTAENIIAERMSYIRNEGLAFNFAEPDFAEIKKQTGLDYSDEQKAAITSALQSSTMILTGGPGTGKTATMNAIITELERYRLKIVLAAPTGRAAKRMSEVSGREAKTIHRLLEYKEGRFQRNPQNPIDANVVIIDEASMIDTLLMKDLVNAVATSSKLILIGDINQLPPVGAGCPLRDIIQSGMIRIAQLKKVFRQAQGSDIVMNAHAINEGRVPRTDNHIGTDFYFENIPDKNDIPMRVITAMHNMIDRGMFTLDDIQLLTPMRREWDPIGCIQLNRVIQQEFNPNGQIAAKVGMTEFRNGDRIMVTQNDYDKGVFNGDIGKVLRKGRDEDVEYFDNDRTDVPVMVCEFEGTEVPFYSDDLMKIDLAYACTVHKSQGSEYKCVIMPIHESQFIMLRRNLVYTGITRAKKCFFGLGTHKAMHIAISNEETVSRYTQLTEKIVQAIVTTMKPVQNYNPIPITQTQEMQLFQ